ncbi:RNA polymerase sigma factor [Intrasporangium sp.]|uniref:RNA polymerase sigma factor n=1 Tax=Intrasporangium sp. TaxID=1925024 RepID=UPI003464D13B
MREHAPRVLGALVRRYGHFDLAEDAVQEALLAASQQWPRDGQPSDPKAWLIRVASRRLTDLLRAERARRRREETVAARAVGRGWLAPPADAPLDQDDSLAVIFLCCHPALTEASRVALTLRAVGGLTTAEIARAFMVPESTMAQRISRAKRTVAESGLPLRMYAAELAARLDGVLAVLYLIFNEGYTASSGSALDRPDLAREAIRLARLVHRELPEHGEVAGLLALMLLTDARRPARTNPDGTPIPLPEQDRSRWSQDDIAAGAALLEAALRRPPGGTYRLQAAIAALHDEAARAEDTDWRQILALYTLLGRVIDNPVVALNRTVAVAMVHGPRAGLAALEDLTGYPRLARGHRLASVRAHLLEQDDRLGEAAAEYRAAAAATTNPIERRYLLRRADRCEEHPRPGPTDLASPPPRRPPRRRS